MKAIFLGTNGWFSTTTGNTSSVLLETDKYHIIFDAGDGFYKIGRLIKDTKPIYLFITHLHLDHITGLHTLNKFDFKQGIKICGQKGIKKLINNIICQPYSADINKLVYKIDFIELKEAKTDLGFSATALSLFHPVPCLGYRIELEGKIISYCLDTGLCENVFKLSKNSDLLITECSFKSGPVDKTWTHLNPESAAGIAKDAKAKKLALIHFNPFLFPILEDRKTAENQARNIFAQTFSMQDDSVINL